MKQAGSMHATCIETDGMGILLLGESGCGKSSLALAMIDRPGRGCGERLLETRLVADDRVLIERRGDGLLARPPGSIAGLLEVRGLGLVSAPHAPEAKIGLAVELMAAKSIPRLPEKRELSLLGCRLAVIALDPSAPFACARLRAAVVSLKPAGQPA